MTTPEANSDLVSWLTAEARSIALLLTPRILLLGAAAVFAAWLSLRVLEWLLSIFWRYGGDSHRRLRWLVPAARIGVSVVLGYALLVGSFRAAPVLTVLVTVAAAMLLVVAFSGPLRSAYVGLAVSWRGKIRPGDRLELDGNVGIVRRFGLLRLELSDARGATVLVPNRLLDDGVVRVEAVMNTRNVHATVPVADDTRAMQLALRRVAMLSPYRVPSSPVSVSVEGGIAAVSISVWGDDARAPAAAQLEETLRRRAQKTAPSRR